MSLDFVQSYAPTPSRSTWRVAPEAYVPRRATYFTPRNSVLAAGPTVSRLPANADRKIESSMALHSNAAREAHRRPVANGQLPPGVNMVLDFPRMRGPGSRPVGIIDARALGTRQETDVMPFLSMSHPQRVPAGHSQPRGPSLDSRGVHMSERGASNSMNSVPSRHYGADRAPTESDRAVFDRDVAPVMLKPGSVRPLTATASARNMIHYTDHAHNDRDAQALITTGTKNKNVKLNSDPSTFQSLTGHVSSDRDAQGLFTAGSRNKNAKVSSDPSTFTTLTGHASSDRETQGLFVNGTKNKNVRFSSEPTTFISITDHASEPRDSMTSGPTAKRRRISFGGSADAAVANQQISDHRERHRDDHNMQPASTSRVSAGHAGSLMGKLKTGFQSLARPAVVSDHGDRGDQRAEVAFNSAPRSNARVGKAVSGRVDAGSISDHAFKERELLSSTVNNIGRSGRKENSSLRVEKAVSNHADRQRDHAATIVTSRVLASKMVKTSQGPVEQGTDRNKAPRESFREMPLQVTGALKAHSTGAAAAVPLSLTNKREENTRDSALVSTISSAGTARATARTSTPWNIRPQHESRDAKWVVPASAAASGRLQTRPAPPAKQSERVSSHVDAVVPLARSSGGVTRISRSTPGSVAAAADDTRTSRGSAFGGTTTALPQQNPVKTPLRLAPSGSQGNIDGSTRSVRTPVQHNDAPTAITNYGSLLRKPQIPGTVIFSEQRDNRSASVPGDVPRLAPLLKSNEFSVDGQ